MVDAVVGNHDVEATEGLHPVSSGTTKRIEVAHIGDLVHRPAPARLDQPDRLGKVFGRGHGVADGLDRTAQVDGDDVGTLLGEADGVALPLTDRRTGDEGDLARELSAHIPSRVFEW